MEPTRHGLPAGFAHCLLEKSTGDVAGWGGCADGVEDTRGSSIGGVGRKALTPEEGRRDHRCTGACTTGAGETEGLKSAAGT